MSSVDVLAVMDAAQFSAHGYCRICCGWEVIKGQGECRDVHTKDCEYLKARAAVAELMGAVEAFVNYDAMAEGDVSLLDNGKFWDRLEGSLARCKGEPA